MSAGRVSATELRLGYGGEVVLSLDRFTVEPGEFVSVLGPSGCGKTTLLNALAGFVSPMAGRIEIDGADVTDTPPHRRPTGMVFQSYALFPHMTVEQNLHYGLKARRIRSGERVERVGDVLELVGLEGFRDRYPTQLSGGQQQRVAIARALVTRPSVLLLDEPLSNLDAKLRRQMREELRQLQRRVGTTMIFVTHDQAEALAMSDRVVLLARGHLEQEGTPEELYHRPRTTFAADFIGGANLVTGRVGDDNAVHVLGRSVRIPHDASPGEEIQLALRPESISVERRGDDHPTDAEVLSSVFAGDRYEYRLRATDGTELRAVGHAGGLTTHGTTVRLSWADEALVPVEES